MTVSSINPASGTTINTGDNVSFIVTHTSSTEVVVRVTSGVLTETIWTQTAGASAGYDVVVTTLSGVSTFSQIKRTSGWFGSPSVIAVEITGGTFDGEVTNITYNIGDIDLYPEGMRPYNETYETGVQSVFGRTGDVVAVAGDYDVADLGDVDLTGLANTFVLAYDSGTATWTPAPNAGGGGGSGDVVGPAGATPNAAARYDGATGKIIKDSGVAIDDSGNVTTLGSVSGSVVTGATAVTSGDTVMTDSGIELAPNADVSIKPAERAAVDIFGTAVLFEGGDVAAGGSIGGGVVIRGGDSNGATDGSVVIGDMQTSGVQLGGPGISTSIQGDVTIDASSGDLAIEDGAGATGTAGQYLGSDGSGNVTWSTPAGGGGGGDVTGPGPTVVDNAIARFDGTGGLIIQSSPVTVSDAGVVSAAELFATGNINTLGGIVAAPLGEMQAVQFRTAEQVSTPTTPASGFGTVWSDNNGDLHFLNDAGDDKNISSGWQLQGSAVNNGILTGFSTNGLADCSANFTSDGNGKIGISGATAEVRLSERSTGPSAFTGSGFYWVRDDIPNVPVFTDDAGADTVLGPRIETLDEGGSLVATTESIDFVGAGVTATNTGGAVTVTIPGGGGGGGNNIALGQWTGLVGTPASAASGQMVYNNPAFGSTTQIGFSITPQGGAVATDILDTVRIGDFVYVQDITSPTTNCAIFQVSSISGVGVNPRIFNGTVVQSIGTNWTTNEYSLQIAKTPPLPEVLNNSSASASTTSATFVNLITAQNLTSIAKNYNFVWSGTVFHSAVSGVINFEAAVNATKITNTGRTWVAPSTAARANITLNGRAVVGAFQTLQIRWNTPSGTANVLENNITCTQVQ